jgi:hypothetical protein
MVVLPLILLLATEAATGQYKMREYVQGNTVWLSTIDPDSADDSGLEAIGKAIGEARVVMLGEQDNGDAPTYLAKTRIIKYLHEKMGFNVLAFESDFFAEVGRAPKSEGCRRSDGKRGWRSRAWRGGGRDWRGRGAGLAPENRKKRVLGVGRG